MTVDSIDRVEALLWSTLYAFETLAQEQYDKYAPELLCDSKTAFIKKLADSSGPPALLEQSAIGAPVQRMLASAKGPDRQATLNIQGLLLERLGLVIYEFAADSTGMSEEGRALAIKGTEACSEVLGRARTLLDEEMPDGAARFAAFEKATPQVIQELDALGEGVDEEFSKSLGIAYADVMGEFAGGLLEVCVDLGMQRRRLVIYLTGQLMGL